MKMLILLLTSLLFFLSANGQANDSSYNIPKWLIHNSSYQYYDQIDSFLKIGDSTNVNACYLKLSPYFLLRLFPSIPFLEKSFIDCRLTSETKDSIRRLYNKTINSERTEPYKVFEKMCLEDQTIRRKYSQCGDTFTCNVYLQKMRTTDSVHFEYLYNYVQKNGWPTLENGCMYAELIGLHDFKIHMQSYLPALRKSVITGNASLKLYYRLLNRAKPSTIDAVRKAKNKEIFDVSYVLRDHGPSEQQKKEMAKVATDCGPFKYLYFVYQSNDKKSYDEFLEKGFYGSYSYAWDIIAYLNDVKDGYLNYDFFFDETASSQKHLTLYIVY